MQWSQSNCCSHLPHLCWLSVPSPRQMNESQSKIWSLSITQEFFYASRNSVQSSPWLMTWDLADTFRNIGRGCKGPHTQPLLCDMSPDMSPWTRPSYSAPYWKCTGWVGSLLQVKFSSSNLFCSYQQNIHYTKSEYFCMCLSFFYENCFKTLIMPQLIGVCNLTHKS